jgi:hypothetical protein
MIRINFARIIIFSAAAILLFGACRKREGISLADNLVVFTTTQQGLAENETSIVVKIKLSRGTDRDIPVTVNFTPEGVVYGTDFTTTPAAASNKLNLVIPSGNNEASFTVSKKPGALYDGDEKITFELYSSGAPVLIGAVKKFTLEFKELVATNSTAMFNGGGLLFPNKAFLDLSANRQTAVSRTSWDLGFYTDPTDFKVILNSSTGMMARQINKNDLTQVTIADTIGISGEMAYSGSDPKITQMPFIDHPSGDITKTAIGLIASTPADNKVFIVNRGNGVGSPLPSRGWRKIRVFRNAGGGYTLQHAELASTTFTSIDVPKDQAYFFKYISFENGIVPVEPEKTKWDIAWTYFGNAVNFGDGDVPFLYQDFMIQNRNVQAIKVMNATKSYADFSEADLASLTLSSAQNTIGADWRIGGGPSSGPSVRTDRFYIIKDGNNNYYKVKFTSMTDAGVRGYVTIDYALVKRG